MPDIMHLFTIHSPPEAVYRALTTPEGVRGWWTREVALDAAVGGTGEFRFHEGKSAARVRIEELDPPSRVVWKTVSSFRPAWDGTTITFELRPEADGGTTLAFAQRGFAEADDSYAITTTGWGYYLASLKRYLEEGAGSPHPDIDFARTLR
jgi:uncharacterized protein YndB with AHSA1/START domain